MFTKKTKKKELTIPLNISEVRFVCASEKANIPKTSRVVFPTESEALKHGIRIEIPCNFNTSQIRIALLDARALIEGSLMNLHKTVTKVAGLKNTCGGNPNQPGCKEWNRKITEVFTADAQQPLGEPAKFRCLAVDAGLEFEVAPRKTASTLPDPFKTFGDLDASVALTDEEYAGSDYEDWIQEYLETCDDNYSLPKIEKCINGSEAALRNIGPFIKAEDCSNVFWPDGTPVLCRWLEHAEATRARAFAHGVRLKQQSLVEKRDAAEKAFLWEHWDSRKWDSEAYSAYLAAEDNLDRVRDLEYDELLNFQAQIKEYMASHLYEFTVQPTSEWSYRGYSIKDAQRSTVQEVCHWKIDCGAALELFERRFAWRTPYPLKEGCWSGIVNFGNAWHPKEPTIGTLAEGQIHCDRAFRPPAEPLPNPASYDNSGDDSDDDSSDDPTSDDDQ